MCHERWPLPNAICGCSTLSSQAEGGELPFGCLVLFQADERASVGPQCGALLGEVLLWRAHQGSDWNKLAVERGSVRGLDDTMLGACFGRLTRALRLAAWTMTRGRLAILPTAASRSLSPSPTPRTWVSQLLMPVITVLGRLHKHIHVVLPKRRIPLLVLNAR